MVRLKRAKHEHDAQRKHAREERERAQVGA